VHNCEITITQRTADNPFVDCLVSCVPVFDSYGAMMGANTVVQDVTERKRARLALQASFQQLRESNARRLDLAGRMISAQEAERQRIARELHDDFSQRLAEISIELGIVRSQLEDSKSSVGDRVGRVRSRSMELSAAMRELSHNLHPAVLKHTGLAGALRGLCDHFSKQQGIQVTCSAEVSEDLTDEVALCLYRIAQEALSNVARHARAKHVQVTLVHRAAFLELTVRDDGTGFEPGAVYKHLGLFSIKERARLVNGTVTIDSARGYGAMVRAIVPIVPMTLDVRSDLA
jgi:signal transduction histidine kinase